MKLKNFIEVTNTVKGEANYIININHITCFKHNRIYGLDGMDLCVVETSEQIQQKIFECQNVDEIKYSCESVCIPNRDIKVKAEIYDSKSKEFLDYINK